MERPAQPAAFLGRRGGVWLDAAVFVNADLDWLERLFQGSRQAWAPDAYDFFGRRADDAALAALPSSPANTDAWGPGDVSRLALSIPHWRGDRARLAALIVALEAHYLDGAPRPPGAELWPLLRVPEGLQEQPSPAIAAAARGLHFLEARRAARNAAARPLVPAPPDLQARVISLGGAGGHEALGRLRRVFPAVELHPAADFRARALEDLEAAGLLLPQGVEALRRGRRTPGELSSPGAVGLLASVHAALADGDGWLLLFEEDACVDALLPAQVAALRSLEPFDFAVFGAELSSVGAATALPGWERLEAPFFFTHCVLWSPRGRAAARAALAPPWGEQVDALLGRLCQRGTLLGLAQAGPPSAWQASARPSSVQTAPTPAVLLGDARHHGLAALATLQRLLG